MTCIAPLATLALTSSLLSWTAATSPIFCTWTKVSPDDEAHYVFLRGDSLSSPPSLRLYHSAWSGERALTGCAWSDDPAVTRSYLSLCGADGFSHRPNENFDLESMFGAEERCVSLASLGAHTRKRKLRSAGGEDESEESEGRTRRRVKRGFIVPGTLWCGSGNKAASHADLGVFSDTDSCCREHDQCNDSILPFQSKFGVFNSNIFTMSHCKCDNKFRRCLKEANDSISNVVEYTFFKLLKMNCFTFSHQLQCTQRNWFGMCKETKMALYADVHAPTLDELLENGENITSSIIEGTTPAGLLKSNMSELQFPFTTVPAVSISSPPLTEISTSTRVNTPERPTESETYRNDKMENTFLTKNQTLTEMQVSCDIYKDLDKCRRMIRPQQTRFGLHNTERRMLYHCNCTSRLFHILAKQKQLTEVESLLLGYISHSCFLLQDCKANNRSCNAVVVNAELPQLDQRNSAAVEDRRHLRTVNLKVWSPNFRRGKRKERGVRLYKLCLKIVRHRQMNTRRKRV
ncbi:group 3 secretory phospholipase A2 [Pholidichthys leucotaenia]